MHSLTTSHRTLLDEGQSRYLELARRGDRPSPETLESPSPKRG
jgi:hypothetical protein